MARQIWSLNKRLIFSSLVGLVWVAPALADQPDELTRAQVYKLLNNVLLLLNKQPPRPAKKSDVLNPQDALRTETRSTAELLFNEGSLIRVDEKTTFQFFPGIRRFQLKNRIAMETIFRLCDGTALILSPPDSVGTRLDTPDSQIQILAAPTPTSSSPTAPPPAVLPRASASCSTAVAMLPASPPSSPGEPGSVAAPMAPPPFSTAGSPPAATPRALSSPGGSSGAASPPPPGGPPGATPSPPPLSPIDRGSAVVAMYDSGSKTANFFALTDSNFIVTSPEGSRLLSLQGGQRVSVTNGRVGPVQEFDLQAFYQANRLVAGLGPGQENLVAQESPQVQQTLNAVRIETLAALRNQASRRSGFTSTFLRDALSGGDSGFDGQKGKPSLVIQNAISSPGIFTRTGRNTGTFTPTNGSPIPITLDFKKGTITIGGVAGTASSAGLSGNNASGTVVVGNGQVIRIEVFGVGGKEPPVGSSFRGSLTTGTVPDR